MKNNRRTFLKMAAVAGGTATMLPLASSCSETKANRLFPDYSGLDKTLSLPVLRKELFASPIIIEEIESIDGVIKVPSGSGMGVIIDPDYINTHKVIRT